MAPKNTSKLAVDEFTEAQAKSEHTRLEAEIAAHDRRYYQEDAPTVSDAEYDRLRQRYSAIESRFPQLRTATSLTQRVGAAPSACRCRCVTSTARSLPARRAATAMKAKTSPQISKRWPTFRSG
jgi:hypothetical protein